MSELHCPKATRLVSDAQDRELSAPERELLQSHMTICPPCARFDEQLRMIRAFVKRWRERA
jgi:hypothetical protein